MKKPMHARAMNAIGIVVLAVALLEGTCIPMPRSSFQQGFRQSTVMIDGSDRQKKNAVQELLPMH